MKKCVGLCAVLGLLFACTNVSSSSDGNGNGTPGMFTVALASDVAATTEKIAGAADTATKAIKGLEFDTKAARQGVPEDSTTKASVQLEVWFADTKYVYDGDSDNSKNGKPKPKTEGGTDNYVIKWLAYDPAATVTTSVADDTNFTADEVTITDAATAKPARKTVQVGKNLLDKAGGAVVVVLVYENGAGAAPSLANQVGGTEKLVARYELTITKAAGPPDLTTAVKVSAKGVSQVTTAATQNELDAAATIGPVAVTVGTLKNTATVVLDLATLPTAGHKVAFNNFTVTGTPAGITWHALLGNITTGLYQAVNVAADGNIAASAIGPVVLSPTARADYNAASTKKGGYVSLIGLDKYGQGVLITVTLEDRAVT